MGVGSIIELSNAQVAAMLGLDVVLISTGGLGSAFDTLCLNKALCDACNVKIRGIVLNRVFADKREKILDSLKKALARWNIPLIGAVPYDEFLSEPSMQDFENLFQTPLLSGKTHCFYHFKQVRLIDTSVEVYRQQPLLSDQLIVTQSSREDIVLATLAKVWNSKAEGQTGGPECGLILTGSKPSTSLIEKITKADLPCIHSAHSSYDAMRLISSFTAKIRMEDTRKVKKAIELVENHLDFDLLIN